MPPKSKKSLVSTGRCRRSERLSCKLKSNVEIQPVSSNAQVSTKKKAKLSNRKKSLTKKQPAPLDEGQSTSTEEIAKLTHHEKIIPKKQPASSDEEQPTSTKGTAKLPNSKKSAKRQSVSSDEESTSTKRTAKLPHSKKSTKSQSVSSDEEQSTSTKGTGKLPYSKKSAKRQSVSSDEEESTSTEITTVKKIRVMEMDEIKERASKMCIREKEDFSTAIQQILEDLCPDLEISEEAVDEMNTYINHIFERLARKTGIFLLDKSCVEMNTEDIEVAIPLVIGGELHKYCVAEGRRAVKIFNEE